MAVRTRSMRALTAEIYPGALNSLPQIHGFRPILNPCSRLSPLLRSVADVLCVSATKDLNHKQLSYQSNRCPIEPIQQISTTPCS